MISFHFPPCTLVVVKRHWQPSWPEAPFLLLVIGVVLASLNRGEMFSRPSSRPMNQTIIKQSQRVEQHQEVAKLECCALTQIKDGRNRRDHETQPAAPLTEVVRVAMLTPQVIDVWFSLSIYSLVKFFKLDLCLLSLRCFEFRSKLFTKFGCTGKESFLLHICFIFI